MRRKTNTPQNTTNFLTKSRVSEIQKWINELKTLNIKELSKIQEYLAKQKVKPHSNDAQIIATVLNCKEIGERIHLNVNMFSNKLHIYLPGGDITTKYLTNDYLYLMMTAKTIINKNNVDNTIYSKGILSSVKIISDNFNLMGIAESGYIQDYDPKFSILHGADVQEKNIVEVINDKPNLGEFIYNKNKFKYFGNNEIVVIALDDMVDEAILDKANKIQYIYSDAEEIGLGVHKIEYFDNLFFFDIRLKGETFCPAFWLSPKEIKINCLFDFELDYNDLYEYLDNKQLDQGGIILPDNLCYWDTLDDCFNFLIVYCLTSNKISVENYEFISGLYTQYRTNYSKIKLIKANQLQFQRIVSDFINAFINNSELSRFINLRTKIENYIRNRDAYKKEYPEVFTFLNSLPFTRMIQNQLKDNVQILADQINTILTQYINGTNFKVLPDSIRNLAREIFKYLPLDSMKDAAFQFITAPGSLLGSNIKLNDVSTDPLTININKNVNRITRTKIKEKKEIEQVYNILKNSQVMIDNYITAYIDRFLSGTKDDTRLTKVTLKNQLLSAMKEDEVLKAEITNDAVKYDKKKQLPPKSKKNNIYEFIRNKMNIRKPPRGIKKILKEKIADSLNEDDMEIEDNK